MKKFLMILCVLSSAKLFSQNVGIGTNNPLSKLHVAGTIRSDTLIYIGPGVRTLFATPNGRIYDSLVVPSALSWEINGNSNITATNFIGTTNANDVIFKTNNIERARILANGNTGIGIANPAVTLEVNNRARVSSSNPLIELNGTFAAIPNLASIAIRSAGEVVMRSNSTNVAIPDWEVKYGTGTYAYLNDAFYVGRRAVPTATAPNYFMMINNAGNMGVGTTTPGNRLEITSATANTSGLRFTNLTAASPTVATNGKALSVDANGDVVLMPSASNAWQLLGNAGTTAGTNFLGTTDVQDLVFKTNNTEKMRVTTGGQVGIGTAAPAASAQLEMAGTTAGFAMPRMTSAQRKAIVAPIAGLQVYDTNLKGFYVYDGAKWDCANNPAGTVQYFANTAAPNGYLECNGQAVNRIAYAELFSAVGTTYGIGDGVTTFNIPDLRGEFVRGADNGRGADPGRVIGTGQSPSPVVHDDTPGVASQNGDFSMDNVAATYSDPWPGTLAGGIPNAYWSAAPAGGWTVYSGTTTGGAAYGMIHAARPRNVALMPCIKF